MPKVIGFLGCPCSGKTTTAAALFLELKSRFLCPVEYISEYARFYISEKKLYYGQQNIILDDKDQVTILQKQWTHESSFTKSQNEEAYIVVDGSYLNSLLYLSDKETFKYWINQIKEFDRFTPFYTKLFICRPVVFGKEDPNRIHTKEQSYQIDQRVLELASILSDKIPCMKELPSDWSRQKIIMKELELK